jgi:hypothetical protein
MSSKCNHDLERLFAFKPHILQLDSQHGQPEHHFDHAGPQL